MKPPLPLFITENPAWSHPSCNALLVPAELTVLPGEKADGAGASPLAAGERLVVSALHASPEEGPAGGTHLSSIVTVLPRPLPTYFTHQVIALLLVAFPPPL